MYEKSLAELVSLAKAQGNKISRESVASYFQKTDEYNNAKDILENEGLEIVETLAELEMSDDENTLFDPKLLDVIPTKITIDSISKRIVNKEIDLTPPFQRKAGIWDDKRKSRLIESIIIKIPLPTFYFDATDDDNWIAIDGLQRLTTIKEFVVDKKLKLSKLEFLDELEGCTFDEIGRKYQRRIEETEINICKLVPPTPAKVKYIIFERLNTMGIKLEAQEIRNALFQGDSIQLLNEMAGMDIFKQIVGNSVNVSRMEDKEFCLGYLGYVIYSEEITSDTNEFLGNIMDKINKKMKNLNEEIKQKKFDEYKNKFMHDLGRAHEIFGKYAFIRTGGGTRRAQISRYLFYSWLYAFHSISQDEFSKLCANKDCMIRLFESFCTSRDYDKVMRAKDKTSVIERNKRINSLIIMAISGKDVYIDDRKSDVEKL